MRYRLDVVASSVVDVVRFAGGWLFDRAMAGWDVSVLLTDLADQPDGRPLQILGAQVVDLEVALASVESGVESRPRPPGPGRCGRPVGVRPARAARRVAGPRSWRHRGHAVGGDLAGRARRQRWPGTTSAEHGRADVQGQGAGRRRRAARLDRSDGDLPKRAPGMPVGRRRSGSRRLNTAEHRRHAAAPGRRLTTIMACGNVILISERIILTSRDSNGARW